MPGDSPLEGAEDPRAGPYSPNPQHLQSRPGWDGQWLFSPGVSGHRQGSQPCFKQQWMALPAAAWQPSPRWHWPSQTLPTAPCWANPSAPRERDSEHHLSQMLCRSGMLSLTTTAPEASFSWSYNPGHQNQYCFSQIKSKTALSSLNWPNALMRTNQLQFSLLMLEVPGIYLFSCS